MGYIDSAQRITFNEAKKPILSLKSGKAPGPDETYMELLKLINDSNINKLTSIFDRIFSTKHIPKEWL